MDDFTHERWLPVVGWEDLYEVSDLGRVRSLRHRGIANPNHWYGGKILKPQLVNDQGHLCVTLSRPGVHQKKALVHRLVMAAFAGPCPEGQEVRHLDGDPSDNRLIRLTYGTRQENMLDINDYGIHYNRAKTHCKWGHEFTPENTRYDKRGYRWCRKCGARAMREWYQKKKLRERVGPDGVLAGDIRGQDG